MVVIIIRMKHFHYWILSMFEVLYKNFNRTLSFNLHNSNTKKYSPNFFFRWWNQISESQSDFSQVHSRREWKSKDLNLAFQDSQNHILKSLLTHQIINDHLQRVRYSSKWKEQWDSYCFWFHNVYILVWRMVNKQQANQLKIRVSAVKKIYIMIW